jgi:hydrogenase maturation protein HypF
MDFPRRSEDRSGSSGRFLAGAKESKKSVPVEGRRIEIRGIVQGVGFRPWVWRLAREAGVSGRVWNDPSGVVVEAFGTSAALELFLGQLRVSPPPAARIQELLAGEIPVEAAEGFVIVASAPSSERRVSIPPDLATCVDCAREVADPADRRHGYPFTNCTNCGPRFSIARDVPWDRPRTTMSPFPMCPRCSREYGDPADRRFHAQPNACPDCGPRLRLARPDGSAVSGDPLRGAVEELLGGGIVAVKGIGGFHLAVDATSSEAVARLRDRKRREEKPLAVMVEDLAAAERIALLSEDERRLLESVERPIVLVRRRESSPLASEIAPGSPWAGLMLAYSPLHLLLLRAVDGRPLVMTSGNLSDEPMATRDDEALARLGGIADLFLFHDREIENRVDDSVARVAVGRTILIRRSRGFVPRATRLRRAVDRPILAVGAHMKNVVALASGDLVTLGPHVGDLDNEAALDAFEESIEKMIRFLGVSPELVAHDLHPDAGSTIRARRRPEPKIAVQHHHAHVAAALAEAGMAGPVFGVAFDGTGYGTDGTAWGGEILLADEASFRRLATLRPLRLAGGEAAIHEPWRVALALLDDAFDGEGPIGRFPLFRELPEENVRAVRQLLRRGTAPLAHGAGRWFDGFAALGLGRAFVRFEGQGAIEWNAAASPDRLPPWTVGIREGEPAEIDLRPAVREAVTELLGGTPAGALSARFHATLAEGAARAVRDAARELGPLPVVLTGGCFQNDRLVQEVLSRLEGDVRVILPSEVPVGDGGIALGQIVAADARIRQNEGRDQR